jgi:L-threonylcarbamoyladenylate synthase
MCAETVDADDLEALREVAARLRDGAVVAARTDTNYGIFCNPFIASACERLYDMKRREATKPLTLFVSGPDDWVRWGYPPEGVDVRALTARFWPGPLNLILRKKPVVPDWVTSGMDTVSVVHNVSPTINVLSMYAGLPLAATSANISGTMDQGLVDFDIAREHVGPHCDYLVRDLSPSNTTMSSTIVSLVGTPSVVRQGDIPASAIHELVHSLEG